MTRPGHPIVAGIDDHFIIPREEMYGEFFDIPEPDCTFLISSFGGGEVFRSGCTWVRGQGKIAYFRPGHETFPSYHDPNVLRVIENAVPVDDADAGTGGAYVWEPQAGVDG